MPIYISEDLQEYLKENYEVDLSIDDNISCKSYNINCCHARVWNSDTSCYPSNYGGYINYQCNHPKFNESDFCEVHKQKYLQTTNWNSWTVWIRNLPKYEFGTPVRNLPKSENRDFRCLLTFWILKVSKPFLFVLTSFVIFEIQKSTFKIESG